MIEAVVFDLDNTLYPEISYVESGFRAVADYVYARYDYDYEQAYDLMIDELYEHGRGNVFNRLLDEIGQYSDVAVKSLLLVYRGHIPSLQLGRPVRDLLLRLSRAFIRTGIITDGPAGVQHRKIRALRLDQYVKAVVCTDELGAPKPDKLPYQVALDMLDVAPENAIYIGDDESKDFIAANRLGMVTIDWEPYRPIAFPEREVPSGDGVRAKHIAYHWNDVYSIIRNYGVKNGL